MESHLKEIALKKKEVTTRSTALQKELAAAEKAVEKAGKKKDKGQVRYKSFPEIFQILIFYFSPNCWRKWSASIR